MSVFVISDPHLAGGEKVNKSMSVFGSRWQDHKARIEKSWRAIVSENDTVVIPGDISWAMNFDDAVSDLKFLNSLPGKKIVGKGNHDFWWCSLSKMKNTLSENGIHSIDFLQNNAFSADGLIISGTRGWFSDAASQADVFDTDYKKICARESQRLELSIKEALKLSGGNTASIRVFLHFPVIWNGVQNDEILAVLLKYGIKEVYFGHIHDPNVKALKLTHGDMTLRLISADALMFVPMLVR